MWEFSVRQAWENMCFKHQRCCDKNVINITFNLSYFLMRLVIIKFIINWNMLATDKSFNLTLLVWSIFLKDNFTYTSLYCDETHENWCKYWHYTFHGLRMTQHAMLFSRSPEPCKANVDIELSDGDLQYVMKCIIYHPIINACLTHPRLLLEFKI